VQPRQWLQASAQISIHRSGQRSGRAAKNRRRGVSTERPLRVPGSAKGRLRHPPAGVSLRLQSVTPTESPCSKRGPLGTRPSRCSLDLFPLRGMPAQPLGLRPPLMCLLIHKPQHPKMCWPVKSRHFRVSIRLSLKATPKSGPGPHGVCNLIRSPKTLIHSQANR
jgi:hypothetical protein